MEQNKEIYNKLKKEGKFIDGQWVVIHKGELAISTEDEQEALRLAFNLQEECLIRKVGEENKPHFIG